MLIFFTDEQNAGRTSMQEGRGPATPPKLTDAGLRGAVVIVTGAVIPLDGGQVIDRE
jgi:hypothetical protein